MSEAITKAAQDALSDLADWHWSRATTLRKAASATAMDKPEPCKSGLLRQADWHDEQKRLVRAAISQPAPSHQPAVPVVSDELIDCLQDVISHNHDFVKACTEMRRLTRDRLGDDDAGYWTHQIDVLARMKTQAAAALAILALRPQAAPMTPDEKFVRELLWEAYPECCGSPCVGAQYMDQTEMVCCGCPNMDTLNDRQIVSSLRGRYPEPSGITAKAEGGV